MAAESTFVKSNIQGSAVLSDGTAVTPITLALTLDMGDLKVGPLMEHMNEEVILDRRGNFVGLKRGKRAYAAVSLSALCGNLVGATAVAPGTPLEFVTGKGAYSANVSTLGANRRMTFDIILTIEGSDWGDTADEVLTMEDVVASVEWTEGEESNTISISGKVLGAIQSVNNTNTVTWDEV